LTGAPAFPQEFFMKTTLSRRAALVAALALALSPALCALGGAAGKARYFQGKVVPLAKLLEKKGVQLDKDAAPLWLALAGDDGKVYPLIKDAGSRMFFKDAKMLDRTVRLTGQLLADSQLLQVVNIHTVKQGELFDVFYWCDICAIRESELVACGCCGGPMELREVPVKK
jgi:hypothetical protein